MDNAYSECQQQSRLASPHCAKHRDAVFQCKGQASLQASLLLPGARLTHALSFSQGPHIVCPTEVAVQVHPSMV